MKNTFLKTLVFLICLLTFLINAYSDNNIQEKKMRLHQIISQGKDKIEYSTLYNIQGNIDKPSSIEITLLLAMPDGNNWIYKTKSKFKNNLFPLMVSKEESFFLLNTQEEINIVYFYSNDGTNLIKYNLQAKPKNKIAEIFPDTISFDNGEPIAFLKENFTGKFLNGLKNLKNYVFSFYRSEEEFPIYPYSFKPLFGVSEGTEFARERTLEFKFPQVEKFDCDFDAKFGYPCSPEEVPAKNPKVLIIEKKQ